MQKKSIILLILLLLGVAYFFLFWPVNSLGARDQIMISIFEPDEFAQYSHPLRMLDQPGKTLNQSIYRFTAYQHYYYGYPFYFYSAVALLPLKFISGLGNTAYNMLFLRQLVSVLPMIAAVMFTWPASNCTVEFSFLFCCLQSPRFFEIILGGILKALFSFLLFSPSISYIRMISRLVNAFIFLPLPVDLPLQPS